MARRRHTPEQITGKLRELGWPWRRDSRWRRLPPTPTTAPTQIPAIPEDVVPSGPPWRLGRQSTQSGAGHQPLRGVGVYPALPYRVLLFPAAGNSREQHLQGTNLAIPTSTLCRRYRARLVLPESPIGIATTAPNGQDASAARRSAEDESQIFP